MPGIVEVEPALEIRMVRDNLALSLSLWRSARHELITSSHLVAVGGAPWGNSPTVRSIAGELEPTPVIRQSQEDLTLRMVNQVRASFAFAVTQTRNTLERVYGPNPLEERDAALRCARCVIHLLSASLRRSLLNPVWDCPAEYRNSYRAPEASFALDATELDGVPVTWEQFGGLDKFLALLEFCAERVETGRSPGAGIAADASPAAPGAVSDEPRLAAVARDPAPPERTVDRDDPVAAFVESRCHVGADAQCPAGSLYEAYQEWCRETGREALAQRSFGMGLTRMGFQRRRRGQGYHWWQGIRLSESR